MAAAGARWNHVWVGTETGILKGGWLGPASGSGRYSPLATAARLTPASRRGEPSAQTGGELHGGGTAAARGGGERPVLGRGRRDSGEQPPFGPELGSQRRQPRFDRHPALLCSQILVGCADRTVRYFSTEEGRFQGQKHCPGGEGTFRGLAQVDG